MCQQYPSSLNPNIHQWISPSINLNYIITSKRIQACDIASNMSYSSRYLPRHQHSETHGHSESKLLSSLSKSFSCLSSGCCSTTFKVATYCWMDSVRIWYASLVTSFPILLGLIHSKSTWAVPMYAQFKCCGAGQLALIRQWEVTSRLLPATFSARTRNS